MPLGPGQQPTNLWNILKFVSRNPSALPVLIGKIAKRLKDGRGQFPREQNAAWIRSNSINSAEIAQQMDSGLWSEAKKFGTEARTHAQKVMAAVPFDMGAGGDYEFLYWLTRYRKPEVIVETGVSAGWSSLAFLSAIEKNGRGTLYSSDFPYFRVDNPDRYIGVLVPEHLRSPWRLYLDGDKKALPRIVAEVDQVDIFHYDSDKSISGREFGTSTIREKLSPDGIVLVDDILDDSWFREHVARITQPYMVLNARCGVLGDIS